MKWKKEMVILEKKDFFKISLNNSNIKWYIYIQNFLFLRKQIHLIPIIFF